MRNKILLGVALAIALVAASYIAFPSRARAANAPNYWSAVRDCRAAGSPEMICHMSLTPTEESALIWANISIDQCQKAFAPDCRQILTYIVNRWKTQ